jgi:tripartite-type tricarboxylate transporter receptor subunit TctC
MKPIASLTLSVALALVPTLARAQEAWPIRSVTFIIPYAAGGYTDLVGRLAARYVERALGKPVIIDNRAGAGGIVGTQVVECSARRLCPLRLQRRCRFHRAFRPEGWI